MTDLRGYHLDPTGAQLVTYEGLHRRDPAAWEAIKDWCRFHDMSPERMPAGQVVVRNVEACRVEYDEIVVDSATGRKVLRDLPDGTRDYEIRRAYSQGEAPPLPFPAILRQAHTQGDPA